MHRRKLLGLLKDYAARYPRESATLARFVGFVHANERCFERDCWVGHVTGSAWLVNRARDQVLLTHHKKLDRWLQVGGHSDGATDPLAVAIREAEEESGLAVVALHGSVFDIDIHEIPARNSDPAHLHFDVRFALQTRNGDAFQVSAESHELAWVAVRNLTEFTEEESVLRMARKWLQEPR